MIKTNGSQPWLVELEQKLKITNNKQIFKFLYIGLRFRSFEFSNSHGKLNIGILGNQYYDMLKTKMYEKNMITNGL